MTTLASRVSWSMTVVRVAGQEAGAAVLHGGGAPGLRGLGDADGGLALVGRVRLDIVDDELLPLLKRGHLRVAGLREQVHVQVVARGGVDGVLGGVVAEPVDVAVLLRHELDLRLGVAVLDVGGVGDVVVERNKRARRLEVAGGVARGEQVRILARRDQQRGLLADVGADQELDLQLDVRLFLQVLAHGRVNPRVHGGGRRRHLQQREGRGRSLVSGCGGAAVAGGGGIVRIGRRAGRASGQHGHRHRQRDEQRNALLCGHFDSPLCDLCFR